MVERFTARIHVRPFSLFFVLRLGLAVSARGPGKWFVETVSLRPSKFILWLWAELSVELATRISGKNPTFL